MKNTNKIVSIVVLLAVLIATVAGAYLGLAGRNTEMVTVTVDGVETERALYRQVAFIPNTFNKNWQEAIVPSAQLGGGIEYAFTAEQGDMSDADFAKAVKSAGKILGQRLEMLSGDSAVRTEGDTVYVTVPAADYDSVVAGVITPVGEITFCFYDAETGLFSEPQLTAEHIKDAGYYSDGSSYQLQVQMTKKGQSKLSDLAKENSGNTLYILQDGGYLGYLSLYNGMETEYVTAGVDDWTYALSAAICLRTDVLPVAVSLSDYAPVEGPLSAVLDTVVTAMLIITVLAALYLIISGKLAGLAAALTLCAQGVVFSLIVALNAVSTSWKLSLTALVLLTVCQLLFIAGLVLINNKLAAALKHRALKPALKQVMKANLKPLSIVYGALIVLGIALMIFFSTQPAAILGRLIALSGLISLAFLFVVLRVLVSCVATLKNSK